MLKKQFLVYLSRNTEAIPEEILKPQRRLRSVKKYTRKAHSGRAGFLTPKFHLDARALALYRVFVGWIHHEKQGDLWAHPILGFDRL
jgi:hypothetical protein